MLKILTIGNSFSDDSMEYVAEIAKNVGVEKVKLGNLYIGGCSLALHALNAASNDPDYEYRVNVGNGWKTTVGVGMIDAIQSDEWDFISMQQASGSSGMPNTYKTLERLMERVREVAPKSQFVWNMTWAYQQNTTHPEFVKYDSDQMTMYNAIVSTVQSEVVTKKEFKAVIPTGTAIQNVRTSSYGDRLTRDGFHLSLDYGRYVAGMTFVHQLTGLSLQNLTYTPEGVSDEQRQIAIQAVTNAVQTPFAVTQSTFTKQFDQTALSREWNDDGVLKLLWIGNSFSEDAMQYVAEIAKCAGVERVVLGNLFIGGCSLEQHLNNATNDLALYKYYKNTGDGWTSTEKVAISTAVQEEDWDYISMQQASAQSTDPDTYQTLPALISYLKGIKSENSKFVWHMTWAWRMQSVEEQLTMYNAFVNAVQSKVVTNSDISVVVPVGTSIQNARTSRLGTDLTRDGNHLNLTVGRYIAGLTFVAQLTGLSMDNVDFAPTGVYEEDRLAAIQAVTDAVKTPFAVTEQKL